MAKKASGSLIPRSNLPEIYKCGLIVPKVDLQFCAGLEIDDRSDCCFFNSPRRQRDNYTVTDMVLTVIGPSLGGHRLLTMAGIFRDLTFVSRARLCCRNPIETGTRTVTGPSGPGIEGAEKGEEILFRQRFLVIRRGLYSFVFETKP